MSNGKNSQHTDDPDEQTAREFSCHEEATTLGLALVLHEPICTPGAQWILDDLDRQLAEIEARRKAKS